MFNVGLRGARMKLVGGDSGRYERETFVNSVVIAPSERVVVDILFDQAGQVTLEHRTPHQIYALAAISVDTERAEPSLSAEFERLRTNGDMSAARIRMADYLSSEPDKALALVAEMNMGEPQLAAGATFEYFCPMEADVISNEPDAARNAA